MLYFDKEREARPPPPLRHRLRRRGRSARPHRRRPKQRRTRRSSPRQGRRLLPSRGRPPRALRAGRTGLRRGQARLVGRSGEKKVLKKLHLKLLHDYIPSRYIITLKSNRLMNQKCQQSRKCLEQYILTDPSQ